MSKIVTPTAREAGARAMVMSEPAQALLDGAIAPAAFLDRLAQNGLWQDALRFLAAALPKREAVWWACTCVRDALPPDAPPTISEVIEAAESWVRRPSEDNRRAASARAEAAGLDKPASWVGMAAFWSGGSITPVGGPQVEPDEKLLPGAVAGAVLLAAVQHEPQRAEERYRAFLEMGLDIAGGGTGRATAGTAAQPKSG